MINQITLAPKINVRAIAETDNNHLRQVAERWWRVHLSVQLETLSEKIGLLAEDAVGVRGFFIIAPQPSGLAKIVAAGLRDSWNVSPYFELLLPKLESLPQMKNLTAMMYVGVSDWLVKPLQEHGFQNRAWVITLERKVFSLPLPVQTVAHLRTAYQEDLADILVLDNLAFNQLWHKMELDFDKCFISCSPHLVSVAELNGQIVGYIWSETYHHHVHLNRLAVHPTYQGQGIGSQLLHQAIEQALATGATRLTLNTPEENYRSCALYRRFGFEYTKQRMPVLWKEIRN